MNYQWWRQRLKLNCSKGTGTASLAGSAYFRFSWFWAALITSFCFLRRNRSRKAGEKCDKLWRRLKTTQGNRQREHCAQRRGRLKERGPSFTHEYSCDDSYLCLLPISPGVCLSGEEDERFPFEWVTFESKLQNVRLNAKGQKVILCLFFGPFCGTSEAAVSGEQRRKWNSCRTAELPGQQVQPGMKLVWKMTNKNTGQNPSVKSRGKGIIQS